MKILILLIPLLGVGIYVYPGLTEHTDGPCTALEKRVAAIVEEQLHAVNPATDPRLAAALNAVHSALPTGGLAFAYVHERFPALPPELGCVGAYWKLLLDPNVTKFSTDAVPLLRKKG
jgi:hypothetical protein